MPIDSGEATPPGSNSKCMDYLHRDELGFRTGRITAGGRPRGLVNPIIEEFSVAIPRVCFDLSRAAKCVVILKVDYVSA